MTTLRLTPMTTPRDDLATVEWHRGSPLPVRPPLLAPEPPRITSPAPLPRPSPVLPFPVQRPGAPPPGQPFPAPRPTPARHGAPSPRAEAAICPTCPYRQVAPPAGHEPTATQLQPVAAPHLPPTGGTGSTTVLQAVAPAPRRRPPPPPPRRHALIYVQAVLWALIVIGLLILLLRA